LGKETVAGAHGRPKWVPHYGAQAESEHAQDTQALLRLCSPSAQVKAAVAHVRRLKRNQRKGKLILSLWVSFGHFQPWNYLPKNLHSQTHVTFRPMVVIALARS